MDVSNTVPAQAEVSTADEYPEGARVLFAHCDTPRLRLEAVPFRRKRQRVCGLPSVAPTTR
jgi:hypothetical protein